jgi:predicted NACHT family NTPase
MSAQVYNWQRFWCPRSGHINLADGGYLYDPEAKWSNAYNPDLVSFSAISQIPCLVLLGEPGIGKSQAIEAEQDKVADELKNTRDEILSLNLRSISHTYELDSKLFKSKKFTDWLNGNHRLHVFLDSLDECLLQIKKLATLLVDELSDYHEQIGRLTFRLACRTAVFPSVLEQGLKKLFGESSVGIYELAPLRQKDVTEAAKAEGIAPNPFLEEVYKKSIVPLAIKPITLKFLLNTYRRHNGQFPENQRLHELYLEGCRCLCEETNESRLASNTKGELNVDQRLIVAARIAAVTVFSNRFAVWTGVDRGDVPDEDVLLRKLCTGHEVANSKEFDITESAIKEVLDTGLFSSRGEQRMGWAHQTYAEFLAAWYLVQHNTPVYSFLNFSRSPEDLNQKLVPQLHETAAWLASMRPDVLEEIIKTDPDILLRSDIPTDVSLRETIVSNLLTQYEQESFFDKEMINYRSYWKLKHPNLAEQLRPYIVDSSRQIDARDTAINIAEVCELSELQDELVNLALDSSESIDLRVSAASAIASIGDEQARVKLKLLATREILEDEYDQLKGYSLRAVFPNYLTIQELLNSLTRPKKSNFTGSYEIFLNYELARTLQPDDLVTSLKWIEQQGLRCFGHPFEELADAILYKSWENFDLPGVAEQFARVAIVQWKEYQRIITHDSELQKKFEVDLLNHTQRRYKLLEQAIAIVADLRGNPDFLLRSVTKTIILKGDIFWMLGRLQNSISLGTQRIWSQVIRWSFDRNDAQEIDAIVTAIQTNEFLREELKPYFEPIQIHSDKAAQLKADYLKYQDLKSRISLPPPLDPPPKERVLQLIELLESGDLSAWWRLNMEMTLKPDSRHYSDEFEPNITKLPGWQEADKPTRDRIVNATKEYIRRQDQIETEWIGKKKFNRPALAGCRAFLLLLLEAPEFLETVLPETWRRWAPVIIAFPCRNQHEDNYLDLVRLTYSKACSEVVETLLLLIDKDNEQHDYIFITSRFKKCWDKYLKSVLLEKAKDESLKPKCMGQLLEELLEHKLDEAREYLQTLVFLPLPLEEDERERVIIASKVLFDHATPSSWSVVWSVIQQEPDFGRELIEAVANRSYPSGTRSKLNEKQLADLYIWLVRQYPHNEDPDDSNDVMAHFVGTRESVANLRDRTLEQLKNFGTPHACNEIQQIAQEFPELTWLKKTLIDAQNIMRRKTWQPPSPDKIVQIISLVRAQTMKKILFLASNPENEAKLRLDKEVREIDEALRRANKRDQFRLEQKSAIRTDDLRRALLDIEPQIVHFSGHGAGDDGIVVEDDNGNSKLVTTEALSSLFELCADHVECVLLNACYSEIQADAIAQSINYVIGMSQAIGDAAAIKFAMGFYDALGAGKSVETAYKFGCNAIQLENIPEHLTPQIKRKSHS